MSKHDFTVRVEVDDAALAEHNERAEATHGGQPLPDDPSEWDERDLLLALEEELAFAEVQGYDAVPA